MPRAAPRTSWLDAAPLAPEQEYGLGLARRRLAPGPAVQRGQCLFCRLVASVRGVHDSLI